MFLFDICGCFFDPLYPCLLIIVKTFGLFTVQAK